MNCLDFSRCIFARENEFWKLKKLFLSVLGRARRPDPARPNPLRPVRPNGAHPATTAMAAAAFLACAPRLAAHALRPYKAAAEPPARLALARRCRPASQPHQPRRHTWKPEPAANFAAGRIPAAPAPLLRRWASPLNPLHLPSLFHASAEPETAQGTGNPIDQSPVRRRSKARRRRWRFGRFAFTSLWSPVIFRYFLVSSSFHK
jgi:hypothetical protein